MWSQLLNGDHYSTDAAVANGKVLWICHTKGFPLEEGTFDYWQIEENQNLDTSLVCFIETHFQTYNGMLNLETLGGKIIEIHLRFADQWPDLYGEGFVKALIELYTSKRFLLSTPNKKGYSVVLFAQSWKYQKPPQKDIDTLLQVEGVTSIQLPFHENLLCPSFNSQPPGGLRVAIINGFDLDACLVVRERLKLMLKRIP